MRHLHHQFQLSGGTRLGEGVIWLCSPLCSGILYRPGGKQQKTKRTVLYHSQKYEEIGKRINVDADRGVTVVNASGFYSGQDVKMLFVLAKQRQAPAIFRLISEIDPHAFVSQSAVIGVYGEGFDKIKYKSKKEHGV